MKSEWIQIAILIVEVFCEEILTCWVRSSFLNVFRVFTTNCFKSLLEGRDEVRDVSDCSVLMVVSVVHFLLDISFILIELSNGVCFDLFNSLLLPGEFLVKLINHFTLHLKSFLLLVNDCFLDFKWLFGQILKNFSLLRHSCVLLLLQVSEIFVDLGMDRCEVLV